MKKMHISELSRQAGLSHATIRLYETHGLITPARDQSVPDEHREYDALTSTFPERRRMQ